MGVSLPITVQLTALKEHQWPHTSSCVAFIYARLGLCRCSWMHVLNSPNWIEATLSRRGRAASALAWHPTQTTNDGNDDHGRAETPIQ